MTTNFEPADRTAFHYDYKQIPSVEIVECENAYGDFTGEKFVDGGTSQGWLVYDPSGSSFVVDLGQPSLLTQLVFYCVNVLSSPRKVQLFITSHLDLNSPTPHEVDTSTEVGIPSEWQLIYTLDFPDRNRQGVKFPPNVDGALTRFYCPLVYDNPFTPEQDDLITNPISNRCRVTKHTRAFPSARFWRVSILEGNGSDYIGVNRLYWYGQPHALPSPTWEENTGPVLRWSPVPGAASYGILVHPGGAESTFCPFFEKVDSPDVYSWTPGKTFHDGVYSFQVVAYDSNGVPGAPSVPSPISGKEKSEVSLSCQATYSQRFRSSSTQEPPSEGSELPKKDAATGQSTSSEQPTGSNVVEPVKETIRHTTQKRRSSVSKIQTKNKVSSKKINLDGSPDAALSPGQSGGTADSEQLRAVNERKRKKRKEIEAVFESMKLVEPKTLTSYESFQEQYNHFITLVMTGRFDIVQNVSDLSVVSIFMSSTFADTTAERNYMMDFGYPSLIQFCRDKGLECNVVDLRWGVSNEFIDDHMAEDVCIQELDRCMEKSIAAAFVFLSSERYGWRNLPNRVEAKELEAILAAIIDDDEARETILDWYQKDENTVPHTYVLQRMSVMKTRPVKHPYFYDNNSAGVFTAGAESVMQRAIWKVIPNVPEASRNRWMVSITEKEVVRGLLERKDDVEFACMCIMRTIEGLEDARRRDDEAVSSLTDEVEKSSVIRTQKSRIYTSPTETDKRLLQELRDLVKKTIPESSFREFNIPWCEDGISVQNYGDYIRTLCSAFLKDVEERVTSALNRRRPLNSLEKEVYHHVNFAQKRAQGFLGRKSLKEKLTGMILSPTSSDENKPMVVYGRSGSGKTSLLCATASSIGERVQQNSPDANPFIVIRMCGTSVASSSAKDLMRTMCEQIDRLYECETDLLPQNFEDLVKAFHERLTYSTPENPLYLFIDSLDQLTNQDDARKQPWKWLPIQIPSETTFIIVSTLPDARYGILSELQSKLSQEYFAEVPLLQPTESRPLLEEWLATKNRTITSAQWEKVMDSITRSAEGVTILHLRILFDRISKLASYDTNIPSFPHTVELLIDEIYSELEKYYNKKLVAFILGILTASRHGLSTTNIIDLVSSQDHILGQKGEAGAVLEYHDPPMRRLPPMVFSRIKAALGDYIVERGANGINVLSLYHRQFIEAAERRYLSEKTKRIEYHTILADYFSGSLPASLPDRGIDEQPLRYESVDDDGLKKAGKVNRQRLSELPYALVRAGKYADVAKLLMDIDYIEAKFESGPTYISEIMEEYEQLLQITEGRVHDIILEYQLFVMKWSHIFTQAPELSHSLAANAPASTQVSKVMRQYISENPPPKPILLLQNQAEKVPPCISTKVVGKVLTRASWSADGSMFCVGGDGFCTVYERLSMKQVCSYNDNKGWVHACCFSPDAEWVLSVGLDSLVHIWDAYTGESKFSLGGHFSRVLSCDWSADGKLIASSSADHTIILWDAEEGNAISVLEHHSGAVNSCKFSPDGKRIVSGSSDNTAIVWDVSSGRIYGVISAHEGPINSVCWSPDGRYILTTSDDSTSKLVDSSTLNVVRSYKSHASEVLGGCFFKSSSQFVTSGADQVCYLYSTSSETPTGYLHEHSGWVLSVDCSANYILTASSDGSAKIWSPDLAPSSEYKPPNSVLNLHFVREQGIDRSDQVHVIYRDHCTRVLQLPQLATIREFAIDETYQDAGGGGLSADKKRWIISQYSSSVYIVEEGNTICTIDASAGPHSASTWHPTESRTFAVGAHGSEDNAIIYKFAEGGKGDDDDEEEEDDDDDEEGEDEAISLAGCSWVQHVTWSSNSQRIAFATDGGTHVWNTEGIQSGYTSDYLLPAGTKCDLSADGTRILILVSDKSLGYDIKPASCSVFDVETGEAVCDLPGDMTMATLVRFSACSRYAFVVFKNEHRFGCSHVTVYDAEGGAALTTFCSPTNANITALAVDDSCEETPAIVLGDDSGAFYVLGLQLPAN